jgi:hypothetical protein
MAYITQGDSAQPAPGAAREVAGAGAESATGARFVRATDFTATSAWGALPIATFDGVAVRLYWTDQPYRWHSNDGDEVFGVVDMKFREGGREKTKRMRSGEIFFAAAGVEHLALPAGPARVLVIERAGSEW